MRNASVFYKIQNNRMLENLKKNKYAKELRVANLKTIVKLLGDLRESRARKCPLHRSGKWVASLCVQWDEGLCKLGPKCSYRALTEVDTE